MLQLLVVYGLSLIRNCDLTGTSLMICRYITTKHDIFDLTALNSIRILRAGRSRLQLPHRPIFDFYVLLRECKKLGVVVTSIFLSDSFLRPIYEGLALSFLHEVGAVFRFGEKLFATSDYL